MPTQRQHPNEPLESWIAKPGGSLETKTLPRISMEPSKALIPPSMKDNVKVINRAELGAMKGRPICLFANSQSFPMEADMDDETTWLQPGESMEVPRGVIVINFGYIFTGLVQEEKTKIIRGFGDYQYLEANRDSGSRSLFITGPPLGLPDLVMVQLDSKKKETGPKIEIYRMLVDENRFPQEKLIKPN